MAVLTRGTLVDTGMLEASPDAAFVLAVTEGDAAHADAHASGSDDANGGRGAAGDGGGEGGRGGGTVGEGDRWIGVCAVDCATGRFLVGAWLDDGAAGGLRTALSTLRPVEVVAPPGGFGPRVVTAVRDAAPHAQVRSCGIGGGNGDSSGGGGGSEGGGGGGGGGGGDKRGARPTAEDTLAMLREGGYFPAATAGGASVANTVVGGMKLPPTLAALAAAPTPERDAALAAFGVMTRYLREAMLDQDLIPLGRVEALPGPRAAAQWSHGGFVALDAAALAGLEVLEDSGGGAAGSLLSSLAGGSKPKIRTA